MPNENLNPGEKLIPITKDDISDTKVIDNIIGQFSDVGHVGFNHPNWDPVAFSIGPVDLRWYSIAYLLGIILGWLYISRLNKKYANDYLYPKAVEALPLWIVLGVVLGGRIGYVLFYNFSYYINNIADIIKVWMGGMSFHGGLIGVIIATYLFSKVYKLQFLKVTDFLAATVPIGLFFGRLANFINKELVGKTTYVSWGVLYPKETALRHPSQLYEAAMEGILLFFILYIAIKFFKAFERKGMLSGIFLIFYGLFRIIAEIFREPDRQLGYIFEHVSMGQVLSLPMIIVGVAILLLNKRTDKVQISEQTN